ncbi:MAG: helix-turn-helix domain-containing protein [Patescibacteria group bacterium]|jgi:sugar-specific transcriptional regulator TrmB
MNNKNLETLIDLGMEDKEARIYLSLLALGNATVADVAQRSGIKRTTIYFILENLKKKGLAHRLKVDTKTFYSAERPQMLLRHENEKVKKLEEILPSLVSLGHAKSQRAKVLFFDSEEGFKQIWFRLFQSGEKEYLIITDPREMLYFVRKNYITGKIIKEKIERDISSRQIIAASTYAKEIVAKDKEENRTSKILPFGHSLPFTTIIFGDNVALISPIMENIILLIESEAFAQTERSKFEALWQSLSASS